ncbi:unnamed protein product [Psylliodes chrysocephalus]|uniref:MADF domain-containing protein n=1 Tax=Psylliodes chrysocephalus TaxID=3402493 RepID=A0A9P0D852_9CUCU|nr:unnamed protein product [Psylliodes chrysocephala]
MAEGRFRGQHLINFIRKFKESDCLWNVKSRLYKRLDLKQTCYEEISKEFKISVAEVKKKIKSLRGTYIAERKKVLEYHPSGSGATEEPYEPNLHWYSEMNFLDSVIIFRKSTDNIIPMTDTEVSVNEDEPNEQLDDQQQHDQQQHDEQQQPDDEQQHDDQHEQILGRKTNKRRKIIKNNIGDKYKKALQEIVSANTIQAPQGDEFSNFGNLVESSLRKLTEVNAINAMAEMQTIITKYRLKDIETAKIVYVSTPVTQLKNVRSSSGLSNFSCTDSSIPSPSSHVHTYDENFGNFECVIPNINILNRAWTEAQESSEDE